MTPELVIEKLRTAFGDAVGESREFRGEHSLSVLAARILEVCTWLKREAGFDMLTDLSAVDHYGEEPRFEVVYLAYSMTDRCHLRLKVRLPEEAAVVDSVVSVWSGANWHEREIFDMFGIEFRGHPNLKRILMWPGYPYFPLRKDFPLAGLPADLPESAEAAAGSVNSAPMAGGPFVAATAAGVGSASAEGRPSSLHREPRQYNTSAEQLVKLRTQAKREPV
jgi:NADH-quinone oxidoreductase subunit C